MPILTLTDSMAFPPPPLTALADGWLVDIDLAHSQLHGTPPLSAYTLANGGTSRMDALLTDPVQAGAIVSLEEIPHHGLPGHNAFRYTFNMDSPTQKVVKPRKLAPFSLPPREDNDVTDICDTMLQPHKQR